MNEQVRSCTNRNLCLNRNRESGFPTTYVIVLNWNGWQDTVECLASLSKATYPDFYVVVVDNNSTNDSVEMIRRWAMHSKIAIAEYILDRRDAGPTLVSYDGAATTGLRRLELIRSVTNLGFCAGNNVGMEFAFRAGAGYALILNNDTLVEPGFLEPLVAAAETSPRVGLVGGVICRADAPNTIWWAGGKFDRFLENSRVLDGHPVGDLHAAEPFETDWVSGCMTLIPRATFESVGGYDESFFIWSEEWDLSLRVKQRGMVLLVVPRSRIYHKVGHSLGVLKPLSYYYGTRNRLLLKRKYLRLLPRLWFLAWFLVGRPVRFGAFMARGRLDLVHAGWCAIRDYFLRRTGPWDEQRT